jgi:heat shock protein 5
MRERVVRGRVGAETSARKRRRGNVVRGNVGESEKQRKTNHYYHFFLANGAAIQGGILSGADEDCKIDIVILDINPLTLGIQTVGGVMSQLIARNSRIPITETKPFTTAADDQEVVAIQIFEGERSMTKDNHFLGDFALTGIPPAPRGTAEIDVTFDIDVNGILNVRTTHNSGNDECETIF